MNLFFCPRCRQPFPRLQVCPVCNLPAEASADTYIEKLLETVVAGESNRAGMAVDVLTQWLREPRAVVPLAMLLERRQDPYAQVLGARGLGRLRDASTIPTLAELLLDEEQPYVSRVAAAEALGKIGGERSLWALEQAKSSPRPSVAEAAARALEQLRATNEEVHV